MTDVPNLPLAPASPPPADGRPSKIGAVISWIVIGLSIALVLGSERFARPSPAASGPAGLSKPGIQFTLFGRYIIGINSMVSNQKEVTEALNPELDKLAVSPADELRAATILGELNGRRSALARLNEIPDDDPAVASDIRLLRRMYVYGPQSLTPDQRQELIDHHGWFGRLALSYRLPATDPDRAALLNSAHRTVVGALAAILGAGTATLAGLVVLIMAIIKTAGGRVRPAVQPAGPPTTSLLEAFAIYLGGFVAFSLLLRAWVGHPPLAATWAAAPIVLAAIVWPVWRGRDWRTVRRDLGLHTGRGVAREIGAGLLGYLAGIPLIVFGLIVVFVLMRLFSAQAPSHPIENQIGAGLGQAVQLCLLACVWAPITEEIMFRGALYHHLRQRFGWVLSAVTAAVLFAIIHPQGPIALPALGAIGFVLATLREWRSSLIASMTAHAVNNFLILTLLLLMLS